MILLKINHLVIVLACIVLQYLLQFKLFMILFTIVQIYLK